MNDITDKYKSYPIIETFQVWDEEGNEYTVEKRKQPYDSKLPGGGGKEPLFTSEGALVNPDPINNGFYTILRFGNNHDILVRDSRAEKFSQTK